LALTWSPQADGIFLEDNLQRLVEQGKIMNTPLVSGNIDDEGTLFSLSSLNVTSVITRLKEAKLPLTC